MASAAAKSSRIGAVCDWSRKVRMALPFGNARAPVRADCVWFCAANEPKRHRWRQV